MNTKQPQSAGEQLLRCNTLGTVFCCARGREKERDLLRPTLPQVAHLYTLFSPSCNIHRPCHWVRAGRKRERESAWRLLNRNLLQEPKTAAGNVKAIASPCIFNDRVERIAPTTFAFTSSLFLRVPFLVLFLSTWYKRNAQRQPKYCTNTRTIATAATVNNTNHFDGSFFPFRTFVFSREPKQLFA